MDERVQLVHLIEDEGAQLVFDDEGDVLVYHDNLYLDLAAQLEGEREQHGGQGGL